MPWTELTPMDAPNAIWTADFKGEFRTRDGVYCDPLTVADRCSRSLLACRALPSTAGVGARPRPTSGRSSGASTRSGGSTTSSFRGPRLALAVDSVVQYAIAVPVLAAALSRRGARPRRAREGDQLRDGRTRREARCHDAARHRHER